MRARSRPRWATRVGGKLNDTSCSGYLKPALVCSLHMVGQGRPALFKVGSSRAQLMWTPHPAWLMWNTVCTEALSRSVALRQVGVCAVHGSHLHQPVRVPAPLHPILRPAAGQLLGLCLRVLTVPSSIQVDTRCRFASAEPAALHNIQALTNSLCSCSGARRLGMCT